MLVQFFNPLVCESYPSWLNFNLRKQLEVQQELVKSIVQTWNGYAELTGITPAEDEVAAVDASVQQHPAGMEFLQGIVEVEEDAGATLSGIEKEIDTYLGMKSQRKSAANILQFWATYRGELPQLSTLARKFLAVPATSLLSEQYFSHTGDVQTPRRNRLSPDMVRMLSYLHLNADQSTIMGLTSTKLKQPLATLRTLKRHQMERRNMDIAAGDPAGPAIAVPPVQSQEAEGNLPQEREYLVGEVDIHVQGDMVRLRVDNLDDVMLPPGNVDGDTVLEDEDLAPVSITFG